MFLLDIFENVHCIVDCMSINLKFQITQQRPAVMCFVFTISVIMISLSLMFAFSVFSSSETNDIVMKNWRLTKIFKWKFSNAHLRKYGLLKNVQLFRQLELTFTFKRSPDIRFQI